MDSDTATPTTMMRPGTGILPPLCDFAIVGGGPAGFFAAIRYAEAAQAAGLNAPVVILEQSGRMLGKVLVSGGGRCNLTNACSDPAELVDFYPRGGAALRGPFNRFGPAETVRWFTQRGLALKTEADGRVFPHSDSAATVAACLLAAARRAGVELRLRAGVRAITPLAAGAPGGPRFLLQLASAPAQPEGDGARQVLARRLLLATGGDRGGLALAARLGHTIVPPLPSLFSFIITDSRLEGLAGLSLPRAALRLLESPGEAPGAPAISARERAAALRTQAGPLLVTHGGLSGPAVLKCSAWGARWLQARRYRADLLVNWLGDGTREQALAELAGLPQDAARARRQVLAGCPFPDLPLRLWQRLARAAGVGEGQRWGDLSRPLLQRLADQLTRGRFTISGKGPFKEEFVTCGGVSLDEVDFKTMQSRLVPGLYLAGEMLDIDGLTGGFNFQAAWTTGWLAGGCAAASQPGGSLAVPGTRKSIGCGLRINDTISACLRSGSHEAAGGRLSNAGERGDRAERRGAAPGHRAGRRRRRAHLADARRLIIWLYA
jgi:predicted Rossmann fold flavoprotein